MADITGTGGWGEASANPMLDIKAAMEKIKNWTPPPLVISPQAARAVNELLERPENTPIRMADVSAAQGILYDRATPEERERMLAASLGAFHG